MLRIIGGLSEDSGDQERRSSMQDKRHVPADIEYVLLRLKFLEKCLAGHILNDESCSGSGGRRKAFPSTSDAAIRQLQLLEALKDDR